MKQNIIPIKDHEAGEWIVDLEATKTEEIKAAPVEKKTRGRKPAAKKATAAKKAAEKPAPEAVKPVEQAAPAAEKKAIDKAAEGDEIVMYLDITLSKKIGNGKEQAISETNAPVKISLQVPAWAINHDPAVSRMYYMLHWHDGEVERIYGDFDPAAGTFTPLATLGGLFRPVALTARPTLA